jgi:hypothetical protein
MRIPRKRLRCASQLTSSLTNILSLIQQKTPLVISA